MVSSRSGVSLKRANCPVVLACDKSFAMPLATALKSMVDANRNSWPLETHLLVDGCSRSLRQKISDSLPKESASIRWVDVDLDSLRGFRTTAEIPAAAYARLLMPRIFTDNVRRVLYLDADVLVLDDLRPLCNMDLEGAVLGAVLDRLDPKLKRGMPGLEATPHVADYFNSGVLLIDLDRWRKERISERAFDYLTQHPRQMFPDQDALNFACDGLWKKLDPRWNFQGHYETNLSDLPPEQRPGIIHFATSRKPWDPSTHHPNAGFYDAFRSRTRFARTAPEKLWDSAKGGWSSLKGALKRRTFVQIIRSRVASHEQ